VTLEEPRQETMLSPGRLSESRADYTSTGRDPIRGVHVINRGQFDARVCASILAQQALLVGTRPSVYGTGAYAFDLDWVPKQWQHAPSVVIDPIRYVPVVDIRDVFRPAGSDSIRFPLLRFFVLPARPLVDTAVNVRVLGFLNCPGFPQFTGPVQYV
jgi:hypothetical protein